MNQTPHPIALVNQTRYVRLLIAQVGLAFTATAAAPAPINAEAVFQKYFDALGGLPAIENIRTYRVSGTSVNGKESLQFEFTFKAPGQILRITRANDHVVSRLGRDSHARCWRQDASGTRDLEDRQAGELMDLSLALHPPGVVGLSTLLDHAVCELQNDGGRETVALGRASPESVFPRLVFDRTSGKLVRVSDVAVEDYRTQDKLTLPFRARCPDGSVFQVETVEINPALAEVAFEKPRGRTPAPAAAETSLPPLTNLVSATGRLEIVRQPAPANFERGRLRELPSWNPGSARHAQVDLRSYDLTKLDLAQQLTNLLHADFDSRTRWPAKLPDGFDRERILALGRDPGLGVRELHRRGITGRGVGIGVIDQTLLVNHVEYRDRLRLYEEIHCPVNAAAQMHGPAVASIAAGRTVGVAPEAELYYIAEQHGDYQADGKFDWDFAPLAKSIDRLLAVNATLPRDRRIRVISISVGWSREQKGFAEAMAAVQRADQDGVFVVSTAIEETHHLAFHGLGREALSDPNDFASYGPGSWWAGLFWGGQHRFAPGERLLVPMDCRGVASPTGPDDYVFYWSGGWSWSVPWISGLYALACQVQPDLTPATFWAKALETGRAQRVRRGPEECAFGTIADPVRLIRALEAGGSR